MRKTKWILVALLGAVGIGRAAVVAADGERDPLPEVLQLPPGFQPEGITRGKGPVLYVAGIANGGIYALDPRNGEGEFLVPPTTDRKGLGIKFQRETDRLFVAGGETGHAYVYDAGTGATLADIALVTDGAPTFINDLVLTEEAAYFTDSFRPAFYKVPLGCDGELGAPVTIALTGDWVQEESFNANGIEVTPRGDLLIVNGSPLVGQLYLVDPSTGVAAEVDLGDGFPVANGDGLVLRGRTLYVVENFRNQVEVFKLGRRFDRGRLVEAITNPNFDILATGTLFRGALYVTNARFTTDPTPETIYTVVRVPIEP